MSTTTASRIERRPFASLGHADHGWLNARHHFSFANYYDPARMGWGAIRVWNDDEIGPRSGFPPHPHSDMEIITYVRTGAITHQDSLGNKGRTEAGDQIWVIPRSVGGSPSWGAKPFPEGDRSGKLVVLASGHDEDKEALRIRADARLLGGTIKAGDSVTYEAGEGRHLYLVPATGRIEIDGQVFEARDGAAIIGGAPITITAVEDSEIVLVDSE
ncbi:MAG: hypothetical protein DI554_14450 [Sphingobium sp.]|nr:MAG: hypothetical protein DI554_14450 [Sphingobium sp.]